MQQRLQLNDRYIRGTVVLETFETKAKMSYYAGNRPLVPIGAKYTFGTDTWVVVGVKPSDFNSIAINVDLEKITE